MSRRHDRRARGHALEQHDAEGLAPQRGRAEHARRRPGPAALLVVADPPEPLDAVVGAVRGAAARRCRGRRRRPRAGRRQGAGRWRRGGRRGPCGARGARRRGRWGLRSARARPWRRASTSMPLNTGVVLAAEVAPGEGGGVGGHRAADVEAVGRATAAADAGTCSRRCRRRRGRCRASAPSVNEQRGLGRPGDERLVEVDDVEVLVAQRPDGAQLGRRVRGEGRHRAVGGGRHADAERGDAGVGRRTVAGRRAPAPRGPSGAQRPGQPEHLHLHAAGHGEAVGAHEPDPEHAPNVDRGPHRCRSRSLGQFGWRRCHCSGARADQLLELGGEVLGDPGDVVAEPARCASVSRAARTTPRGGRCPRSRRPSGTAGHRCAGRGWPARRAGSCARRRTRPRRRRRRGRGRTAGTTTWLARRAASTVPATSGPSGTTCMPKRLAQLDEPLVEVGRLERLDDDGDRPGPGTRPPRSRPTPSRRGGAGRG